MSAKKPGAKSEVERAEIVADLSAAWFNMTQEGQRAPPDILMMLEHRLRAALRDGPCPECPDCALHAALEESVADTEKPGKP